MNSQAHHHFTTPEIVRRYPHLGTLQNLCHTYLRFTTPMGAMVASWHADGAGAAKAPCGSAKAPPSASSEEAQKAMIFVFIE
ncbi:hypothetical protein [Streptomyces sp. NPDC055709]